MRISASDSPAALADFFRSCVPTDAFRHGAVYPVVTALLPSIFLELRHFAPLREAVDFLRSLAETGFPVGGAPRPSQKPTAIEPEVAEDAWMWTREHGKASDESQARWQPAS